MVVSFVWAKKKKKSLSQVIIMAKIPDNKPKLSRIKPGVFSNALRNSF